MASIAILLILSSRFAGRILHGVCLSSLFRGFHTCVSGNVVYGFGEYRLRQLSCLGIGQQGFDIVDDFKRLDRKNRGKLDDI